MLHLRNTATPETVRASDKAGIKLAEYLLGIYRGGVIAAYWSVANEFSTHGLLSCLWNKKVSVALPAIMSNDTMAFYRIGSLTKLQEGKFGIPTPPVSPENMVIPEDIALMVVPGVAFDRYGNRLGMGKGYYDRYLAQVSPGVVTVGAAYEFQIISKVPVTTDDHPVGLLWTEQMGKCSIVPERLSLVDR